MIVRILYHTTDTLSPSGVVVRKMGVGLSDCALEEFSESKLDMLVRAKMPPVSGHARLSTTIRELQGSVYGGKPIKAFEVVVRDLPCLAGK